MFKAYTNHEWKGFRFTQTYLDSGSPSGCEAKCRHSLHQEGATACRRRRLFSNSGGPAMTERGLKHWCIAASECRDRIAHRDQPAVALDKLPTLAELEAMPAPDLGVGAKRRRIK